MSILKYLKEALKEDLNVVDVMDELNPRQRKMLNDITLKINIYSFKPYDIYKLTKKEIKFIYDLAELYDGAENEPQWIKKLAEKITTYLKDEERFREEEEELFFKR